MVRKKKLYSEMSAAARERAVRRIMDAGGSNRSAAKELGTTPGTIAGFRNRKDIPSKNESGFADVKKSQSGVPLKMAATEATQCTVVDERGLRCAYEHVFGSPYCGLPQHQKLAEKARRS